MDEELKVGDEIEKDGTFLLITCIDKESGVISGIRVRSTSSKNGAV